VGHATRQDADGLHALRLRELSEKLALFFVILLFLGDVKHTALNAGDFLAVLGLRIKGLVVNPSLFTGAGQRAILQSKTRLVSIGFLNFMEHSLAVVGVDEASP